MGVSTMNPSIPVCKMGSHDGKTQVNSLLFTHCFTSTPFPLIILLYFKSSFSILNLFSSRDCVLVNAPVPPLWFYLTSVSSVRSPAMCFPALLLALIAQCAFVETNQFVASGSLCNWKSFIINYSIYIRIQKIFIIKSTIIWMKIHGTTTQTQK